MKKWKWLFFSLLVINLIFLIIMAGLALQPSTERELSTRQVKEEKNVSLGIIAKKEDLNVLINKYLQKEFHHQPLNYEVRLTNQVEVYGTIEAFGNELDISMAFEPEVQKNGDLILKQESLSVGKLSLPIRTVLKYVNNNFSLPQWVQINAKEESVYVALQQMEMKSDFRVKVKQFDLEKNDIQFTLVSTD
ncbi:MAG TPA: YpmS family protein [Bacillus sp. (in: firmicutes)]|nr:YpmS family protein [Bacillus sp. (in: firmicutes)]